MVDTTLISDAGVKLVQATDLQTAIAAVGLGAFITLVVIVIASILIKGLALYKAAQLNDKFWFWAMLILNTAGILPIIYLIIKRKK